MVFVNSQGPIAGMGLGFPDVCLTPSVVPVPIPYPNIAMRPMSVPTQTICFTQGMPNHNAMTQQPVTMGDNAGVNFGVASGMVMGPSMNLTASKKVFEGPAPVTRMLDTSAHNGISPNIVGLSVSPTQTIVIVLG